ncbi:MAG TPA: hypothetical protein VLZ84_12240 [Asticcacaulis sp.]|nr:hypothetical protein [Asticcacaulis sp.]
MPAEDLTNVQSGQEGLLKDAAQGPGQGQNQGGLTGLPVGPLDADTDSGTEALTGSAPQEGYADETIDNAGTDNFAPEADQTVEEIDSDHSTEPAGSADPRNAYSDQDETNDGDRKIEETEDVDGDGI